VGDKLFFLPAFFKWTGCLFYLIMQRYQFLCAVANSQPEYFRMPGGGENAGFKNRGPEMIKVQFILKSLSQFWMSSKKILPKKKRVIWIFSEGSHLICLELCVNED
jgi:hypothetical protein